MKMVCKLIILLLACLHFAFAQEEGEEADNSRCQVCHINFVFDDLAVNHAKVNIGCETCHGVSDAHCSDEDNIIPPDIMFPMATLNLSCLKCHEKDKIPAESHEAVFSASASDTSYCTDCHGDHRLTVRTRRWNRETGELIYSDNVRMLNDEERKFMEDEQNQ